MSAPASIASRTVLGAAWMIAWRMTTRGLGLLSTLVLARLLAPSDFGLVALATTFAAAVDSLSELGLQAALMRRPDDDPSLYDTAFTMQAIRGMGTGAVIALGAAGAGAWFGDGRLTPLLLVLAAVAAVAGFDNIAVVRFQRELRFDMEFRLLFAPRLVQFVLATGAAFALHSYWALMVGVVAGRLARTAMTYWVQPCRPCFSLARWRDLAGFSFWSWASSMAGMAWERGDAFVLGPALGAGQLGVFLLSAEIGLLPTSELVGPAGRALYAGVAAARNRGADVVGLAVPLMAALLMLVLPVGIGISATAGYLVAGLLGPAWEVGRPVIAIIALLCLVTPVTFVSGTVLSAAGHVRQNFWAMAGATALRVCALGCVAGTRRLDWAALTICGVVLCEALLLLAQVARCGRLAWRGSLPGMARTLAANSAVAGVLWASGLGWQDVGAPALAALLAGGAVGLGCIAGCAVVQSALWLAAGRPPGPERTVFDIVCGFAARLRRQPGPRDAASLPVRP